MKKQFAIFKISMDTGSPTMMRWGWYETEQQAFEVVMDFDYSEILIVLPVYIPTSLQE